MVQALIELDENANRVLNIVKAKFGLKDKSEAINTLIRYYVDKEDEPELKPEFIERIKKAEKGKFIKVSNFAKHYGAE
jgi:hypothetical protein